MSALHVTQAFQPAGSGDFPVARSCEPMFAYSRTVSSYIPRPQAPPPCLTACPVLLPLPR